MKNLSLVLLSSFTFTFTFIWSIHAHSVVDIAGVAIDVIKPVGKRCAGFESGPTQMRISPAAYNVWDGGRHLYKYQCYVPFLKSGGIKDETITDEGMIKSGSGLNSPTSPNEQSKNEVKCPGSVINVGSRTAGEKIAIAGAHFDLVYFSDRAVGRFAESVVNIPISVDDPLVTAIEVQGTYADGQTFGASFPNTPGQHFKFRWNNKDSLGNYIYGSEELNFKVIYTIYGKQVPVEYAKQIGGWKVAYMKMGGWQPNIYHYYDFKRGALVQADSQFGQRAGQWHGSEFHVATDEVKEVFVFNDKGRHLRTLNGLTGVVKYEFQHDIDGNLINVVDRFGLITSLQRDPTTKLVTSITAPKGQVTQLTYAGTQLLSSVIDPLGNAYSMTYNGVSGLLATFTKPEGETSFFSYDSDGMLIKDEHSGGSSSTLLQEFDVTWYSVKRVILETALGKKFNREMTNAGEEANAVTKQNGTSKMTRMSTDEFTFQFWSAPVYGHTSFRADSRFPESRFAAKEMVSYYGKSLVSDTSREVELSNPADPFSVVSLKEKTKVGDLSSLNEYVGSEKKFTKTSGEGRIRTSQLDIKDQLILSQTNGVAPTLYSYYEDSNIKSIQQGARKTEFKYDVFGYLKEIRDAIGRTTKYSYNKAGKLLASITSDGRQTSYEYDKNGRLTTIKLPHGQIHQFSYNEHELLGKYQPPELVGTDSATLYTYNLDMALAKKTLPDGREIKYIYNPNYNRVDRVERAEGNINYGYSSRPETQTRTNFKLSHRALFGPQILLV